MTKMHTQIVRLYLLLHELLSKGSVKISKRKYPKVIFDLFKKLVSNLLFKKTLFWANKHEKQRILLNSYILSPKCQKYTLKYV